jgi:hypothetical protein
MSPKSWSSPTEKNLRGKGAAIQIFEGASQKIPKNSEKLRGKCGDRKKRSTADGLKKLT